jgi:hypothetical protein
VTTDPQTDRPEVDDPRVLALAKARQQMAHSNPFNVVCPPWDGLTEQEQQLSLLDARNYLRAAINAGLTATPPVAVPPTDQAARSERYAAAIRDTAGWVLDDGQHMIAAVMAVADAEQAELRRERDLAIAHDRQPYPTAWAYEQACAALHRKTDAIERVRAVLETEAVVGRSALEYRGLIASALLADEEQQPETQAPALGCGCPDEDAVEHGFGTPDCTCIPFTRQETPPRYLNRPTDTVDMISGWERGGDCPHHAPPAVVAEPGKER